MQKIKRWLKLLAYALLVLLALVGIGVTGVPVPPQNKKEEKIIEINVEMLDDDENESKTIEFNRIN